MIFRRTLTRELTNTTGAVFVALFIVFLTMTLIKVLGQAANGRVASEAVVALIAFASLNTLPLLLPPTLFVAVLLVLTRWYRDHEMLIWLASGVGLLSFIRTVMRFALPLALITTFCSFVVSPWAAQQSAELRQRFEHRSDTSRVLPGEFSESSNAERVFFVQSANENGKILNDIFVSQQRKTPTGVQQSIIFSRHGTIGQAMGDDYFVVLENGLRYDGNPGRGNFDVTKFARYGVMLDAKPGFSPISLATNAMPTQQLLHRINQAAQSGASQAELIRRISWPLMLLNLACLAVPLSYTALRAGRSMNVLLALLFFIVYNNLSYFVQARVTQETTTLGLGWWLLHGIVLLFTLALLYWRQRGRHDVGRYLGHLRVKIRARLLAQRAPRGN